MGQMSNQAFFGSGSLPKVAIDTCKMPQSEKRPCSSVGGREGGSHLRVGVGRRTKLSSVSLFAKFISFLIVFYVDTFCKSFTFAHKPEEKKHKEF